MGCLYNVPVHFGVIHEVDDETWDGVDANIGFCRAGATACCNVRRGRETLYIDGIHGEFKGVLLSYLDPSGRLGEKSYSVTGMVLYKSVQKWRRLLGAKVVLCYKTRYRYPEIELNELRVRDFHI